MLIENRDIEQTDCDLTRRWFSDNYFDLIVWEDKSRDIVKFELCYNKFDDEHAFVWELGKGHAHMKVDDGEKWLDRPKMSPVLIADGIFDKEPLTERFLQSGTNIDKKIADFILNSLKNYSGR